MRIFLTSHGTLSIHSELVSLFDACPVVNDVIRVNLEVAVECQEEEELLVRYRMPDLEGAVFCVQAQLDSPAQRCNLKYWIEELPKEIPLNSFGLCFKSIENLSSYLRNGYFSWDGSSYVQPDSPWDFETQELRPEKGYAMTQLLPRQVANAREGSIVLGFDRHDRFQQTFTFNTREIPLSLTIETLWDQKARTGLERCEAENLLIFEHFGNHENALRMWAHRVAATAPTPPRLPSPPITGWCSWYNLYAYINEENILTHLEGAARVARRENLPMQVFQIDDGFTPEMGDWLEVKPQFPRGMKPLLDDIRAAGFIPGLWIAPFMVGNRSQLFHDHPGWVLKNRQTGVPLVQWKLYGEFRWHKRSEEYYILDTTHPEAFEYLRLVFRTWRRDWGCEYFKTDFMHFGSENGPEKASWHTPGLTRIEVWRRVAEMIREELDDALWLGCGCPLWVPVGLVDGIRIGSDVGVNWTGHLSAQSLIRDLSNRNFANQILWQSDPDCILLRNHFHHLSESEVRSLAIYAGMSGGVTFTSDALDQLPEERLRLWKLILPTEPRTCEFPFLGKTSIHYERLPADTASQQVRHEARLEDPVLVQVRRPQNPLLMSDLNKSLSKTELAAIFFFNTGEKPVQRSYPLTSLGLSGPQFVYDWFADSPWPEPIERFSLTLPAHDGKLLFVSPQPFLTAPERLP